MSRCFKNNNITPIISSKEYTEKRTTNTFACTYNSGATPHIDKYGKIHFDPANPNKVKRVINQRHRLLMNKGLYDKNIKDLLNDHISNGTTLNSSSNIVYKKDTEILKPSIKTDLSYNNSAFHFSGDLAANMAYLTVSKNRRTFTISAIQGHTINEGEMGKSKETIVKSCPFYFK